MGRLTSATGRLAFIKPCRPSRSRPLGGRQGAAEGPSPPPCLGVGVWKCWLLRLEVDLTSKVWWLSRPCQEGQHGRWVLGEGPSISLFPGVAGQHVPLRAGLGLSSSLVVKRGPQGRGGPWSAGEHPTVSGSASFPREGRWRICAERPVSPVPFLGSSSAVPADSSPVPHAFSPVSILWASRDIWIFELNTQKVEHM